MACQDGAPVRAEQATVLYHTQSGIARDDLGPAQVARLASAEVFNPVNGTWASTGNMTMNRVFQSAALLPSGDVLVAGGCDTTNYYCTDAFNSAELYIFRDR